MYKIDAHNHPDYIYMNYEKYIEDMDKVGIDKVCLLAWEAPTIENDAVDYIKATPTPINDQITIPFERCLSYYEKAPDRFILGYAPDPRKPFAVQKMQSAIDTYGVKICGEVKFRMLYDNPDAIDLFNYCGERGVLVILHLDIPGAQPGREGSQWPHFWYGGDIFMLERVLQQCPNTNFLGHAPAFWGAISNDDQWRTNNCPQGPVIPGGKIEEFLEKYPNLHCDCSAGSAFKALSRDKEYTKKLMLKHPDRFIYARDNFTTVMYDFYESLDMPEDIKELFYHGNIERLMGLNK